MSYKILLVDDSRTVRSVMSKTLRIAKVPTERIFEAANGQDALDIVAENDIDLMFVDINMPVMNGVELVEKLRAAEATAALPVIIVSSERSKARLSHLMDLGVLACIEKPFDPAQVRDLVNEVLGDSNA